MQPWGLPKPSRSTASYRSSFISLEVYKIPWVGTKAQRESKTSRIKHLQVLLDDVGLREGAVGALDGSLTGTGKTELGLDALNTVGRVDVLDKGELPAGGTTLAGGNGGSSKEVLPDLLNEVSN